jgi:hypothetical protein
VRYRDICNRSTTGAAMTIQTMLRHTAKTALALALLLPHAGTFSQSARVNQPAVPKTWDDTAMETLEVPLANPIGSLNKSRPTTTTESQCGRSTSSIPCMLPAASPPDTWSGLKQQEPVVVWDDATHKPKLRTEAD